LDRFQGFSESGRGSNRPCRWNIDGLLNVRYR
jgi:hypothetical protein